MEQALLQFRINIMRNSKKADLRLKKEVWV